MSADTESGGRRTPSDGGAATIALLWGATGNVGHHVARRSPALLTESGWAGQTLVLTRPRSVTYGAEHFEELYQLVRDHRSEFVSTDVERVLGRTPRTVEGYLRERRGALVAPVDVS